MFVILQPQTKQKSLFSEVGKDFNKEIQSAHLRPLLGAEISGDIISVFIGDGWMIPHCSQWHVAGPARTDRRPGQRAGL